MHDFLAAVKNLARSPGYAAAFILTLGLGIGANTAIFSAVRAVLLKPIPHRHGDRLVHLRQTAVQNAIPNDLSRVDPGYQVESVLSMEIPVSDDGRTPQR